MTVAPPRQMKLFNLGHTGPHIAGWRHPNASTKDMHGLPFHQEMARISERGKFDAIFFADAVGFVRARGRAAFSRVDGIRLDPITLLSALAATTTHLGLVATASTLNPPFTLARQFAALDHISGGRSGWNIVTTSSEYEAHNFGLDKNYNHDERYERAAEYVEIVKALWDGVEDDALLMDKASGRYLDTDKIHAIAHKGKYYSTVGPLGVARPPQGYPVLIQAGASPAGLDFCARFAECVFTSVPRFETARDIYGKLKQLVAEKGRDPDGLKIMPSVKPVMGSTEAEAKALMEEMNALVHSETALAILETYIGGFDLSAYDIDGPVPDLPVTEGIRSAQAELIEWAKRDNLTIRQLAHKFAGQRTGGLLVGTPEQIADLLEQWFNGGAADGFAIGAAYFPGQFEVFVDEVVPILQRRGVFRRDYEGATLRENLGLARPPNSFELYPERHAEPEVW